MITNLLSNRRYSSAKELVRLLCVLATCSVLWHDLTHAQASKTVREVTPHEMEQVHNDVRRNLEAVYNGDVDTVIGFTNQHMIRAMGGADEARTRLKDTFARIKAAGITIESLEFPVIPEFLSDRHYEYVVVPTEAVIARGDERIEATNFQLGVRPVGSKQWAYFDGSRINSDNIYTLYPDFPRDYVFPEIDQNPL